MSCDITVEILQTAVDAGGPQSAGIGKYRGGIRTQGALEVESSAVVSFTKTRRENEDPGCFARGEAAHIGIIVVVDDCVNKAIALFAVITDESRAGKG